MVLICGPLRHRNLQYFPFRSSQGHQPPPWPSHYVPIVGAMSIRPLPRHVAEQIKSSAILTSLNDAASGLVKNSLDADATAINIYLDYAKGACTVEDNGVGIPPSEFRLEGGLGKAHRTCVTRCDSEDVDLQRRRYVQV